MRFRLSYGAVKPMKTISTSITIRVVKVILFAVIVIGAVQAWRYLDSYRAEVYEKQSQLAKVPEELVRYAAIKAEINKRELDVSRVEAFIVSREQLAEVVGEIEAVGRALSLAVSVPEVAEKQLLDDKGNQIEPSGPLIDVRMKIVASGPPKNLIQFLHSVEHMQRLVYLESWRLDASERAAQNQISISPLDRQIETQERLGLLTAEIIVAVKREGGSDAQ